MTSADPVSLRIAIERLSSASGNHYAIWVVESPYPGGYVHHDQVWSADQQSLWQTWLEYFSLRGLPQVPHVPSAYVPQFVADGLTDSGGQTSPKGYTSRLMQTLGLQLWEWLFDGPIQSSLDQSLGIAMGQDKPLRLGLDIRDPDLISLPWEIMQSQPGRQAFSLAESVRFSRTTSDVDPLPELHLDRSLKILLVLGQDDLPGSTSSPSASIATLQLQAEADTLKRLLQGDMTSAIRRGLMADCQVDVLLQPSPAALTKALERGQYNVFFYAGHGVPAPDGGFLFLQPQAPLNGTELAQVLTRCRVKVAVFNTCWGAQPDQQRQQAIARSSLAEVLLHHGVPAVLAMRDSIADEEALSFIQAFTQALAQQHSVDRAVAIARQQLLTLYKFNQPAWTLPVLYMHPDFDGQVLAIPDTEITRLPGGGSGPQQIAAIRSVDNPTLIWPIYGGMMRVGRLPDNDLVIPEPWVSSKHAEIFCRQTSSGTPESGPTLTYYLRDYSRYGTLYQTNGRWSQVHRQEVALTTGTQLRFGSPQGRLMEFVLEVPS
ncbi:CHAT domain-containing protein [Leptolyngbya sp. PCC 6406]|uniref:CHAT domain-containing protein n=1 Tax=Leptolyngbya sp. PCC 6406 TaxID=1173264 RepID=UPI0002ABFADB|nr:CHAT domain-containing protein [Leptolyngbya sp. PCC 6406]